jgi:hypothetical protein
MPIAVMVPAVVPRVIVVNPAAVVNRASAPVERSALPNRNTTTAPAITFMGIQITKAKTED